MAKQKKTNRMPWHVRQGDVFIELVAREPAVGDEIPRDATGRVILAAGEVTGHHHAIRAPGVCHLRAEGVSPYTVLRVTDEGALLEHEEHAPIALPPGTYRVSIQREYSEQEIHNVAD
jgi:hypothetical protein